MGSRVRIRLLHILHFVMEFLFPLLKNSKSGVDDRGHRLRITHTRRRRRSNSENGTDVMHLGGCEKIVVKVAL